MAVARVRVVDSQTAGEPTRLVLSGGPDLGGGTLAERLHIFQQDFDWFRAAVVNEPRGSDVLVGGLLCPPVDPRCSAGVIFFNNVSYLGMCGHGTMGLVATLQYLDRLTEGRHLIETPVGIVTADLHSDGSVTVHNVPSYRHSRGIAVDVDGLGWVSGDIAWGGNWFFLTENHGLEVVLDDVEELTSVARRIKQALEQRGLTGAEGAPIDHIELTEAGVRGADSRNFVLCPGNAYDRSPCGTGTCARVACLAADGELAPGKVWVQESIIGSRFEATYTLDDQLPQGWVWPSVTGYAYPTLEGTLLIDDDDPFRWGIGRG